MTFLCVRNLIKANIQASYCSIMVVRFQCCLPRQGVARITPFSSLKNVAMIFPADGKLFNFFLLWEYYVVSFH